MGRKLFCDFCNASIPIESQIRPVVIGDKQVAEVCMTCASKLEQGINQQKAVAAKAQPAEELAAKPEEESAKEDKEAKG